MDKFTLWYWQVLSSPSGSSVTFNDGLDETVAGQRDRTYFVTFSHPGTYIIQIQADECYSQLFVQDSMLVEVL